MSNRTLPVAFVLFLLAMFGLAGCGAQSDEQPPADDSGTRLTLPERREIRDGVVDAKSRPFMRAHNDETDSSLHVIYVTGVEPCAVLGDIVVEEGADEVVVTLMEGYLPAEDGQPPICIEIAEDVSARVPLDRPLGDRSLVDGATGDTVPVDVVKAGDAPAE